MTRGRLTRWAVKGIVGAGLALASACSDRPFPAKSTVKSVRILATRADLPYAHPGETVNLETLVWDGREKPTLPMHYYWFPVQCINPPGGEYFGCYPLLEQKYPNLGVDLGPQLLEDTKMQITIPTDALDGVPPDPAHSQELETTQWVFMFACAGSVQRKARTTAYQENEAPFGCFGPDGKELDADQGVFGFTRVTITQTRRNAIPQMKFIVFRGKRVDPNQGVAIVHCTKDFIDLHTNGNCDTLGMDVAFDEDQSELDPDNVDPDGKVGRETLYTDWFVTLGRYTEDRRIEFDPFAGRPEVPNILYEPPRQPGNGILWAVFHDNRGGTTWSSAPIIIQ